MDLWPTTYVSVGDKLIIPAGALHAEGEVSARMVYIVGIPEAANLFERLTLLDPKDSPLRTD